MIALLGTMCRRGGYFTAGFLLGFLFYESDSEVRHRLAQLMHDTGITTESVALILPMISEWFSQQHNKKLMGY